MKREQIFGIVAWVLVAEMGVSHDEINNESTFDDLSMDSLDRVECLMALEDEFDIEVNDEEAESWHTVKDVVDHLEKNIN